MPVRRSPERPERGCDTRFVIMTKTTANTNNFFAKSQGKHLKNKEVINKFPCKIKKNLV
jgi:hypothetical protein